MLRWVLIALAVVFYIAGLWGVVAVSRPMSSITPRWLIDTFGSWPAVALHILFIAGLGWWAYRNRDL